MKINHLNRIIMSLISFLIVSTIADADDQTSRGNLRLGTSDHFAEVELRRASPFHPDIIQRTFKAVAQEMHISINPRIPFPDVVVSSQVPVEKMPEYLGLKLSSNLLNYYSYLKNTIVLNEDARIHQLAHEFVHYFQYHYCLEGDINRLTFDPEPEAVRIQNRFRGMEPEMS